MMQAIMWIILGGTVGLAALVDRGRQNSLEVRLGDPTHLDGIRIRLPRNWAVTSPDEVSDNIELQEPGMDDWPRTIKVSVQAAPGVSLFHLFDSSNVRADQYVNIPFGDAQGQLAIRRITPEGPFAQFSGVYVLQLTATRQIPKGRFVQVELQDVMQADKSRRLGDIELVKKIAATLELDAQP